MRATKNVSTVTSLMTDLQSEITDVNFEKSVELVDIFPEILVSLGSSSKQTTEPHESNVGHVPDAWREAEITPLLKGKMHDAPKATAPFPSPMLCANLPKEWSSNDSTITLKNTIR